MCHHIVAVGALEGRRRRRNCDEGCYRPDGEAACHACRGGGDHYYSAQLPNVVSKKSMSTMAVFDFVRKRNSKKLISLDYRMMSSRGGENVPLGMIIYQRT